MTRSTVRLTMAQALIRFLAAQRSARDGSEQTLFGGVFGIFGHGNVAGIGQALQEHRSALRYYLARNEQAMVHTAAAFAKMQQPPADVRLHVVDWPRRDEHDHRRGGRHDQSCSRCCSCRATSSRHGGRRPCCSSSSRPRVQDVSVNDCFKPVSRYWDRITRPEQIVTALPEAMRVLTSPAETGAVTLSLPQDVQTEAFDYPAALFEPRVWTIPRPRADRERLHDAARMDPREPRADRSSPAAA